MISLYVIMISLYVIKSQDCVVNNFEKEGF